MRISPVNLFCTLVVAAACGAATAGHAPAPATTAPAPRYDAHIGSDAYDWAEWSKFWAFQPVRKPAAPAIAGAAWGRNEIDAFVLAKLSEKDLAPSGEADKLTLLRRVTFDLTGLPPTPEEVRAFLADKSADAYERVVDRLLASPHYGERWGRHWLDVARYTPGRVSFPGVKGAAGDSHYRDYVVRAFNTDKPYDQFVTEQLAGDLLAEAMGGRAAGRQAAGGQVADRQVADRQVYFDRLVAPAFLSIGAWFDQETDPNRLRLEMVDEMVNATTRAFLGQSIACARCHDHKFDPIPIQDYYALAGVFRSTRIVGDFSEYWRDGRARQLRPLALPDQVAANDAVRRQIAKLKAERWSLLQARHAERTAAWKADEARYRAAAAQIARPFAHAQEAENFDGQDNLRIAQLMRGGKAVELIETQTPSAQWVKYKFELPDAGRYRLEALHSTDDRTGLEVTANGDVVTKDALAEPTGGADLAFQRWDVVATCELPAGLNFVRLNAKAGNFPRIDRLRLVRLDEKIEQQIKSAAEAQKLDASLLERFVYWPNDPWPTAADAERFLPAADVAELARLSGEADRFGATIKPYPLAVAVTDQAEPVDLPVYLRGNTYRTSEYRVPRGLPRFLDHALPRPPIAPGSSGRLELARWLTDSRHPLTSRVMVNRIWGWHFGKGLVDSPSDFGSRGSTPSHPELLDWLAATFVEQGWSIKRMHRLILTSSTYRQAGAPREPRREPSGSAAGEVPVSTNAPAAGGGPIDAKHADPENRLLSHFPRRRLEAEALYDAMLSTTNALVRQPVGKPLEFAKSSNRAMYTLMTGRSPKNLGGDVRKMLGLFDCDLSGAPVSARTVSATPAQSLFWLNSPLVKFFADNFAARLLKMDKLSDPKRVEMAYLLAVGRSPSKQMTDRALAFVRQCEEDGESKQQAWTRLCQALYASSEFRYVD